MNRYNRTTIIIAMCLSLLAGFVDAVGFLHLQGAFVSFMSGNSTRFAVNAASQDWIQAGRVGAIILSFVAGVSVGTTIAHLSGRKNQAFHVLCAVTVLLTLAAVVSGDGFAFVSMLILAHAMGAENATFQRDGDIGIGLTYMTGTLVKFAQRLTGGFFGRPWTECLPYLALWTGLICGAICGAVMFGVMGLQSIWIAVVWAALVTGLVRHFNIKGLLVT
jgi:uncharacterized membrane protein YoaK (UPF0700 family)